MPTEIKDYMLGKSLATPTDVADFTVWGQGADDEPIRLPYNQPQTRAITTETDTITQEDNGKVIGANRSTAQILTVTAPIAAGFNCLIVQEDAGQTIFEDDGTVTIINRQSHNAIAGEGGGASLVCRTANVVFLMGDTAEVGGGGGGSLLDDLIAWWKLDEASGNAIDAHGANDLTDTNAVGSAAGKVGNARDFEVGGVQYFTIADNADLSTGDIDFTVGGWFKFETTPLSLLLAKADNAGQNEFFIIYNSTITDVEFSVTADGSTTVSVGSGIGVPTPGTWYFLVAWHDSVANTINIQVNNGTVQSDPHSGGVHSGTAAFTLGALAGGVASYDGLIDEAFMYKRVLTSDERTALYNAGAGVTYEDLV